MGKIRVQIKAPFGEIVVEGDSAQEILATLKTMPPEFMGDIGNLISAKLTPPIKTQLEGIVELTTEGPIITTREKLTHYEAIGLVLFASDKKSGTATQISRLLASSGIRSMVPAAVEVKVRIRRLEHLHPRAGVVIRRLGPFAYRPIVDRIMVESGQTSGRFVANRPFA